MRAPIPTPTSLTPPTLAIRKKGHNKDNKFDIRSAAIGGGVIGGLCSAIMLCVVMRGRMEREERRRDEHNGAGYAPLGELGAYVDDRSGDAEMTNAAARRPGLDL